MFKFKKVSEKVLTKDKVEKLFSSGNIWHEKKELTAIDLAPYNEIAAAAFQDQRKLLRIEIPNNILKIGNGAFINCLRLKQVILPDSIKSFGLAVFAGCFSLKKVNIPTNFSYIPTATFADCALLENVELKDNIKKIGSRAFANCLSLKTAYIPQAVEVIKENAFINCPSLEKGIFSSIFYYQAHNFGMFEEQFNVLNTNLKSKICAEFLFEQKLITRDEFTRIMDKVHVVKFAPRPVEIIVPPALLKDKKEDNELPTFKSNNLPIVSNASSKTKDKKAPAPKIPEGQKHTVVPLEHYLNNYNYDARRKEWHKKAGHNDQQLVCWGCKDDDNWETILLDNNEHVCYYCWIKKPAAKKPAPTKNALVVKKAPAPKIPEGQKHTVVPLEHYLNNYNYDARRKEWHKKAGHNDQQLVCWGCKDDDNWETILLDNNEHVCYYCWVKKPATKKPAKKKSKSKKTSSAKNALVVKKEPAPKPKKVNGIEVTKKHVVLKASELEKYNYDKRRKQWHANAGYSEKQLICSMCKDKKHTSVLTSENKHICYNCFIKKPKPNQLMVKPKSK